MCVSECVCVCVCVCRGVCYVHVHVHLYLHNVYTCTGNCFTCHNSEVFAQCEVRH